MSQIEANHDLNTGQYAEHLNFIDYADVRESIDDRNINYLQLNEGDQELTDLRTIADNNTGRSSTLAQNILCFGYAECAGGSGSSSFLRVKGRAPRVYDMTPPAQTLNELLESSAIRVTIRPNPATDFITINLEGLEKGVSSDFILNNLQGQKVIEVSNLRPNHEVNVAHLKKGVYLYSIISNDQEISKGKLILQ